MTDLLKVDFKRFFKDKMLIVLCILGAIFGTSAPLLMGVLSSSLGELLSLFGVSFTAKQQFFNSFASSNNMGLIAPILIAIVIAKDFRHGTIRNKIISGKDRMSIYLSMFITCATMLFSVMLLHAMFSMIVSLMFFPFQETAFDAAALGYFMISILLELLCYLFFAALICLLCTVSKSSGLAVISYIAIIMVFAIVTTVLQGAQSILVFVPEKELSLKAVRFFQKVNIFNYSNVIGAGTKYNITELIYMLITPTVATVLLLLLGIFKFNRKDLK